MTTEEPKNLIIPLETAQELLNYLIEQPYGEVVNLVQSLRALKLVPENDTEEG